MLVINRSLHLVVGCDIMDGGSMHVTVTPPFNGHGRIKVTSLGYVIFWVGDRARARARVAVRVRVRVRVQ